VIARGAAAATAAVIVALALSGCDEEFCSESSEDPVGALIRGFLCSGNKPAGKLDNDPPTASFTIEPGRVEHGGEALLDASASSDPDGRIVRYEWDLDYFGSMLVPDFEVDAGSEPAIRRRFVSTIPLPGRESRLIALRVTDDRGAQDETAKEIVVDGFPLPSASAGKPRARRAFSARLTRVSFPRLGNGRRHGAVRTFRAVRVTGRLRARGRSRGLGPLRRFRRAAWVARLDLSVETRTGSARLAGLAVARFPRGVGRTCVRITMATRKDRPPVGRLTVLGGTRAAGRLAGGGRFTFRLSAGTPRVRGRIGLRESRPRPLPAGCARIR
jgi:hypothetical protein